MATETVKSVVVMVTCTSCDGKGWVPDLRDRNYDQNRSTIRCYTCNGSQVMRSTVSLEELRCLLAVTTP